MKPKRPAKPKKPYIEVRDANDENWGLDEIVASGARFHMERMDRDTFWFQLEAGGKIVTGWLQSTGGRTIKASVRDGY